MIEKINQILRAVLPGLLLFILPASPVHASPPYGQTSHSGSEPSSKINELGSVAAVLFALLLGIERRAKRRIRDRWEVISRAYPLDATLLDREGRCIEIFSVSTMPFETGSLINEMLPLDASEKLGKALNAVFEEKKADPVEFSIKNAWYEASFVPMEGKALCFIAGISRWRDAGSEKEKLPSLLRSIGNGIIVTDENGLVTYLNPMAEKLTGWQNGNSTGIPLPDVFRILVDRAGQAADQDGSRIGQGYGIARPMPGDAFGLWMETWNRNPEWLH